MKKMVLLFAAACMMAACGESDVTPVVFEAYEQEAGAQTPDGIPAHIGLRIDVPQGTDGVAKNIVAGIRQLIAGSQIATELGEPADGVLPTVGSKYVETFLSRMAKGELEGVPAEYQLGISCEYQNEACVRFHVVDGIYGNGGPYEYDAVVRKSDGHVMQQDEMVNISMDDLRTLVSKHATDEQKESLFIEEDGYQFSPDPQGCRFHWAVGSHFFQVVVIPLDELEPYLTEEAKQCGLMTF